MKLTLETIKSRLMLILDIETAAIACEFEEDGTTINQDEYIFIAFSIPTEYCITNKDKEEKLQRYRKIAENWKEAIFMKNTNVKIIVIGEPIHENFGKFKKLDLFLQPDIIITKEDLADRFLEIGYIKEAWIVCEVGDPEEYINYMYDMGIYIKLTDNLDDEKYKKIHQKIYETLFLLFNGHRNIYDLVYLKEDEKEIKYKWMELMLEDMTKIL